MFFSTPRDEYCVSDHDIWAKDTSDDPFQSPNNDLRKVFMTGQQESTENEELVKNTEYFGVNIWAKNSCILS